MLAKIKALLQCLKEADQDTQLDEDQHHLACAALLVEVAVADHHFDETEIASLKHVLHKQYAIPDAEIDDLIKLARQASENATSMYQFTRLVNEHCSQQEKFELVKDMWTVAYADGSLDKYEEYVIRKVTDLIYLGHSEFIRAKHASLAERRQ